MQNMHTIRELTRLTRRQLLDRVVEVRLRVRLYGQVEGGPEPVRQRVLIGQGIRAYKCDVLRDEWAMATIRH